MVFVESTIGNLPQNYFESHKNEFYIKNTEAYFVANVTSLKDVEREDKFGVSVVTVVRAKVSDLIKTKGTCRTSKQGNLWNNRRSGLLNTNGYGFWRHGKALSS